MRTLIFFAWALGCSSSTVTPPPDLAVDKSARCTDTFGTALTAPYGRLDGTVLAVLAPGDMRCPRPNMDHLILEVSAGGAVYRMVVNVQSDIGPDFRALYTEKSAPVPAFVEGWHAATLDYEKTLGMKAADFAPKTLAELTQLITDHITLDAPVSVFASTSGGDSAHLVHRNAPNQDGAIVIDPMGQPLYLLFAFYDSSWS